MRGSPTQREHRPPLPLRPRGKDRRRHFFTLGSPPQPSSVPSCLSRHDKKTASRCGSWCTRAKLPYFSRAHPPPTTVGGWPPPDPEKSSSAKRYGQEAARSKTAWDIFRGPDRAPRLREITWPRTKIATRISREPPLPLHNSNGECPGQWRPLGLEAGCRNGDASRPLP